MRQDIACNIKPTTQDQTAAEIGNTEITMPDQPTVDIIPHQTTSAPSEELVMECTQPATTETQILTIQVLCPMCSKENDINMDKLWQWDNKDRFCKITCASCRSQTRIGAWCSSRDVQNTSVKQWLQRHSYNGKTFLKHDSRAPTATVELFNGVAASTTNLQESESSKRKSQDVTDDNAKRRRRDETQPK